MWYLFSQARFNVAIVIILMVTLVTTSQLILAQNNSEQHQLQVEYLSQFDNLYDCINPPPVCPDPEDCEVNDIYGSFDTFEDCITPTVTIFPDCINPPPVCPDPEDCEVNNIYGSFDTLEDCVTPTPSITPTPPVCPDPEDCDLGQSNSGLDIRFEGNDDVFVPSNPEPCEIFTYLDC